MSKRSEKVAETIHTTISSILSRGLNDPRIGFVTLTAVEVIDDLSLARIYYTVIGDEAAKKSSEAGLNSAKGHLRKELGRVLTIRHIPELIFKYDHSQEYGNRIDSILKEIGTHDGND
ncbi:ribosome-binding factor A [Geobacter sp. SVR]|uniref:ribosome-binding factor A n=1 Tax=Geobacter sp. SVR TaxID=2495594 RepID=UPI00143F029E|nr:ribosome-binding factor A [Geobacter sp. SVR]BCS53444.1 ribosome-binding factor A [Geobacter sp. SVR]GCF85429.1 ribosome-binding factor A [Geobacter sp. SVR]